VTVCTDTQTEAESLLAATLEQSGFWNYLDEKRKKINVPPENFCVLIKPDLEFYEVPSATGTDPALVEHLVSLLAKKGYTNVIIADGDDAAGLWLENRDIYALAELVGYKYKTRDGVDYQVLSLSENLENAGFDNASLLKDAQLSAHWLHSHFRIVFCKNKTDEEFYYSLGLKSLINILPQKAKHYHYYFRFRPEEIASALLERNEVDFCIIDAWQSNNGKQGSRHSNPLLTNTFIAGNNILLTDWAASLKMGIDPYSSAINSYALKKYGLPKKYSIKGQLDAYNGWISVPLVLSESTRTRNKNPVIRQLADAWLQSVDTDIFPFKNVADAQVNKFIAPVVKDIDNHPLAYSALVSLNYLLAGMQRFLEGWQTLYNKEKIYRQQTELGFSIEDYESADFEDVENYIRPLMQIVQHTAPDKNGLKWRYIDESVLFEFTRTLPYDYDLFVKKVDIAASVQNMFDNIGGARVAVKTHENGKVLYQAERDIYLPQPNWMVLFGGQPIDASKIEVLRYTETNQSIFWRTVKSLNNSAEFDDGMVSFSSLQKGITEIKIVARQKFALPLFWKVFNIDYVPKVKDALVSSSYIQFFSKTIANFEAVYEGRNPGTGRLPDPSWGENDIHNHPLQADQIKNILALFTGLAEKWLGKKSTPDNQLLFIDEKGYSHFASGKSTDANEMVRSFVLDISNAIKKDIQYLTWPKQ